jgi:flagellar biosynthesis/type III secretory pathway protein FliH
VPPDLPPGPHREAVELANEATFTQLELDAYRKVMDEIQQAREYGDARWAEGKAEGKAEGETAALARTVLALLAARGVAVTTEARAQIEACKDVAMLDRWILRAATASSAEDLFRPSRSPSP